MKDLQVKKRVGFIILIMSLSGLVSYAGTSKEANMPDTMMIVGDDIADFLDGAAKFLSKGKPFVRVFADYSNVTFDGANENSFNITRAYFGYGHSFDDHFSAKLTLDFGDPRAGRLKRTAFLKHAYAQYKGGIIDFLRLGISGTLAFGQQEKFWGYRYVYHSAQDRYGFSSSADLGVSAQLKINKKLSVDGSIFNGEGFRELQVDSIFRYSLGMTLKPTSKLHIRGYWDFSKDAFGNEGNQITYNAFVGYKMDKFRIGGEYASQHNFRSRPDGDRWVISIYGTYNLSEKINVYGRYDYLNNENDPLVADLRIGGSTYIIGGEFKPVKGIHISPNYTLFNDQISGNTEQHTVRLNLLINL